MKLCFGDKISDVGGSGVGNGGLLYSQDVSEEASTRGLVDGTSVLSGDITRVILQMDEEALLIVGNRFSSKSQKCPKLKSYALNNILLLPTFVIISMKSSIAKFPETLRLEWSWSPSQLNTWRGEETKINSMIKIFFNTIAISIKCIKLIILIRSDH